MTDPLRSLLRASHLLAPDDLAAAVAAHARVLGVLQTVLYLADYEQVTLVPLPGAGVPAREALPIDATLAGRAFRRVQVVHTSTPAGGARLWVPLLDGVERLGVAELELAAEPSDEREEQLQAFVTLVAELIVVNDAYSDVFARRRRRRTLSLAAELQWQLLPPLTFGTDRVVITGALAPAYEIGGDSFDYAVNDGVAELAVVDAIGHGLSAALLAALAIGAYRHARRSGLDLPAMAAEINTAVAEQFGVGRFATGVLARLDLTTGRLRWVNAGHPPPLILRGPALVHPPPCPPSPPLGLQDAPPAVCSTRLEPGDRLLLYTDGITESRSPGGGFFGEHHLADFIKTAVAAGDPAPEMLRRLLQRVVTSQGDRLRDDATIVVLEWRTGREQDLQLARDPDR